ncbi:hypothetical protein NL676_021447 [Syzygium grande]|nr:hypothetical protein NL676_021447 [Syzygium grande]
MARWPGRAVALEAVETVIRSRGLARRCIPVAIFLVINFIFEIYAGPAVEISDPRVAAKGSGLAVATARRRRCPSSATLEEASDAPTKRKPQPLLARSCSSTTYENFRYRAENRFNAYDLGCFSNFFEVFCTEVKPSRNNFRAFVQEEVHRPVLPSE